MQYTDRLAGSLLSVNVGLPQDVTWKGRTVHTAVWKRPVEGPRMVRRLNIDGDGQGDLAGHGGGHPGGVLVPIGADRDSAGAPGRGGLPSRARRGEPPPRGPARGPGGRRRRGPGRGGSAPPAWPGFRPLAVTAMERESDSVASVHLADPRGAALPPALPGQFLTLRLTVGAAAPPLLRSYSLSGAPGADTYRISVKR